MDEALWLPTEKAVRVALRTQQIIAHESGVADTIDPLAGSYIIEYLTDEIERCAGDYIHRIDELGGALDAIEQGYIQREIQEAAYQYQKAVENGEQIVVGLNAFQKNEAIELERLKVDPAIEEGQQAAGRLRAQDAARASSCSPDWETPAARKPDAAVRQVRENEVTLGEICGVLRKMWGEYSIRNALIVRRFER
jgi:methylmalonyl-CoA mutase N-terminal domain/subunit